MTVSLIIYTNELLYLNDRHRHVDIAMYYHCVALVESLRNPDLDSETRDKYETQLYKSERRLDELATHSEVNYRMYHRTVVSNRKEKRVLYLNLTLY
jgi:type IV secretory pathway VirD2 relaxase